MLIDVTACVCPSRASRRSPDPGDADEGRAEETETTDEDGGTERSTGEDSSRSRATSGTQRYSHSPSSSP